MTEWSTRPLASHDVAVFVDAVHVKVRDGQVSNRPFSAAIGVDLHGHRDVRGLWAGTPDHGESSQYDIEIRRLLSLTNDIDSLNARYRRTVNARGHLPTEQAALTSLYLTTRSLDPKDTGRQRWMIDWKSVLNILAITYTERMPTPRTL